MLEAPEDGRRLHGRGIVYAPDFVINGGGVIAGACEREGLDFAAARERMAVVYDNVERVLDLADREGLPASDAADRLAEQRLAALAGG